MASEASSLEEALKVLLAAFELAPATDEQALRKLRADHIGLMRAKQKDALKVAAPSEKRDIGLLTNRLVQEAEAVFEKRLAALAGEARAADLARTVDVTLPGRAHPLGHLHPVTLARREIEDIFAGLGFVRATGPQVETDWNNFVALAMPADHPARDMQDTFYVDEPSGKLVLRTHTSPVQIRTMLSQPPPVRVICPGPVYRRDDDPTHSPMFHQVEGLLVDERVSFAELKGTLLHFARRFLGEFASVRLRPSFFPFTEPSAELDFSCVFCKGTGKSPDGTNCRVCKGTSWLEVGGAGMVDPEVFRHVGYDGERYTGFAFGFGIDRMAMLKYGIADIKLLFDGDQRFLEQFG